MSMRPSLIALLPIMLSSMLAMSCGRLKDVESPESHLATVHIDQSAVKSQGRTNLCWAYAFMGMIESRELERGGVELDLSEEYLAFHLILDHIRGLLAADGPIAETPITDGVPSLWANFAAIDKFGIVPESVFQHKFPKESLTASLQRFSVKLRDPERVERYRADDAALVEDFAEAFGARPPLPEATFMFEGREYDAHSFARERLKFSVSDYQAIKLTPGNMGNVLYYLKAALLSGHPVPFGLPILTTAVGASRWDVSRCPPQGCPAAGGHVMLAVDYVTRHGQSGAMPRDEAVRTLDQELTELIFKNNRGLAGLDQKGEDAGDESKLGYTVVTSAYLREVSGRPDEGIEVILPKLVFAESDDRPGHGLHSLIEGPDYGVLGEASEWRAHLVDWPNDANNVVASYAWELKDLRTGVIASSQEGRAFTSVPETPGVYELALVTTLGKSSHRVTKKLWLARRTNVLESPVAFTTNNVLRVRDNGKAGAALEFDTRREPTPVGLERSIATLPPARLSPGDRLRLDFHVTRGDESAVTPLAEASTDGGKSFSAMTCVDPSSATASAVATSEISTRCEFPRVGGWAGYPTDVVIRLVFDDMPQPEHKWRGLTRVWDLTVALSSEGIARFEQPAFAFAAYPDGASVYRIGLPNQPISLEGVFGNTASAVRVYVDDELVATQTDLEPVGSDAVKATFARNLPARGRHKARLVAVVAGHDSSSVDYDLLVVTPESVDGSKGWVWDFKNGEKPPVLLHGGWRVSPRGLDATSEGSRYGDFIPDNQRAVAVMAFDLTKSRRSVLVLDLRHELEEDYDYFKVEASTDGGATFESLYTGTGVFNENTFTIDLARFDGSDQLIVRLDVITDCGGESDRAHITDVYVGPRESAPGVLSEN